jgi:Tfp pilus assembly protein PilO
MPADITPPKRKSYVSIAGFSAIFLGFLGMSYIPHWRECQSLNAQIMEHKEHLEQIAAQTAELKDVTEQVRLIHEQVKGYDRLVPASQDLGTFLGQLSNELSAAGLQDSAVRAMAPTLLAKCQQLPIEIHGTGTAAQCHAFLTRLEALPRKSSVSHLTLEADAAMTGKVTMELTLCIYNLKPQ